MFIDPHIIELGKNAPWFLVSAVLFFMFLKVNRWVVGKVNDLYDIMFDKDKGKVIQLLEAQQSFVTSVDKNQQIMRTDIQLTLDAIKSVEKKISYMNSIGVENMNSDYFNVLFEQTPIPIAFVDSNLDIMRANEKCCNFLGYNNDEIIGIKILDITSDRDRKIDSLQAEKIKTGDFDSYKLEKTFVRKNGDHAYCTVFVYRIPAEGPFNHFIKVIIPADKAYLTH